MARYITMNLVNEGGVPLPWDGDATQFLLDQDVEVVPVWIGVSADGLTNQVYPLTTSPATILATWPRLYQGVQISADGSPSGSPSGSESVAADQVFYLSLEQYERLAENCCLQTFSESSSPSGSPSGIFSPEFSPTFS